MHPRQQRVGRVDQAPGQLQPAAARRPVVGIGAAEHFRRPARLPARRASGSCRGGRRARPRPVPSARAGARCGAGQRRLQLAVLLQQSGHRGRIGRLVAVEQAVLQQPVQQRQTPSPSGESLPDRHRSTSRPSAPGTRRPGFGSSPCAGQRRQVQPVRRRRAGSGSSEKTTCSSTM